MRKTDWRRASPKRKDRKEKRALAKRKKRSLAKHRRKKRAKEARAREEAARQMQA